MVGLKTVQTCSGVQQNPSDLVHRVLVVVATVREELAMRPEKKGHYETPYGSPVKYTSIAIRSQDL